jgi:hypothetical protein
MGTPLNTFISSISFFLFLRFSQFCKEKTFRLFFVLFMCFYAFFTFDFLQYPPLRRAKRVSTLQKPTLAKPFGRGVVSSFGKGITTQNPPRTKEYSNDYAVIVNAFQRVLRTSRTV